MIDCAGVLRGPARHDWVCAVGLCPDCSPRFFRVDTHTDWLLVCLFFPRNVCGEVTSTGISSAHTPDYAHDMHLLIMLLKRRASTVCWFISSPLCVGVTWFPLSPPPRDSLSSLSLILEAGCSTRRRLSRGLAWRVAAGNIPPGPWTNTQSHQASGTHRPSGSTNASIFSKTNRLNLICNSIPTTFTLHGTSRGHK
jgi:hypothetical protein